MCEQKSPRNRTEMSMLLFSCAGFSARSAVCIRTIPHRSCRLAIVFSADRFFRPYHNVVHWSILLSGEFQPCQPVHIVVPPIWFLNALCILSVITNFPVRFLRCVIDRFLIVHWSALDVQN